MSNQRMDSTNTEVESLQRDLAAAEKQFEHLRKQRNALEREDWSARWDSVEQECASIRRQLHALTGDAYGRAKAFRAPMPSEDRLNAEYNAPWEVPPDVRDWVRRHAGTLTSDATDAVRWGRIEDTLQDERYPPGDLTVYRVTDAGDAIRPGDWVTTQKSYAEDHLRRYVPRGRILEEIVDGRDVLESPTGNAEEAIFAPRELSGRVTDDRPRSGYPSPGQ